VFILEKKQMEKDIELQQREFFQRQIYKVALTSPSLPATTDDTALAPHHAEETVSPAVSSS
jgi:hypothetical protein